jgi:hypothetical protein
MVVILIFEFLFLFFLSRTLTSSLSLFFYRIFKSTKVSVTLLAIIFLPGTIIHEFAHATMAKLLFVDIGKMELMPKLNGESLKLGSVQVEKTDMVRNFFIGIAPFLIGAVILFFILFFSFSKNIFGLNLMTFAVFYILFTISNTMYSSKKDMEGAVEFIVLLSIFVAVFYFLGVRIPQLGLQFFQSSFCQNFLQTAVFLLAVPIVLDIVIIFLTKIVMKR